MYVCVCVLCMCVCIMYVCKILYHQVGKGDNNAHSFCRLMMVRQILLCVCVVVVVVGVVV